MRKWMKDWNELNPILADGEVGEIIGMVDTKTGDGKTPWRDLSFTGSVPVYSDPFDVILTDATSKVEAAKAYAVQRSNHTGVQTSSTISDFIEAVQDAVALLLGAGTNITINYDDVANTLTVATTAADAEAVRDAIGVALVGVGNISIGVNDALDTITISTTATVNSTDAALRDRSTHSGTQLAATISDFNSASVLATKGVYPSLATSIFLSRRDLPGIHALPVINPAPPTFSLGTANAATAISGSINVDLDAPGVCTVFGTPGLERGVLYPDYTGVKHTSYISTTSIGPWAVEFILDTADATGRFEVDMKGNGGGVRVLTRDPISGRWLYVSSGNTFAPPSDGSIYKGLVTLGAPGIYTIRLELSSPTTIFGVRIGPTDTIRGTGRLSKRVIVVGDSFTEPTIIDSGAATPAGDGFPQLLSYSTGYDVWSSGSGGTGYLQTNGARVKVRDRLASDVIAYAPDEIWWAVGINDSAFTPSAVSAEATLCWQQVAAALPNCKQVVLSPFWPRRVESVPANTLAIRDALAAAAASMSLTFLDLLNLPLVGSSTSTTLSQACTLNANSVRISGTWPSYRPTWVYLDAGDATKSEVKKVSNVTSNGDGTTTLSLSVNTLFAHASGATARLVGPSYMTGTGRQGTPIGDGNADRYTGSDTTHPTKAGHRHIADTITRLYRMSSAV